MEPGNTKHNSGLKVALAALEAVGVTFTVEDSADLATLAVELEECISVEKVLRDLHSKVLVKIKTITGLLQPQITQRANIGSIPAIGNCEPEKPLTMHNDKKNGHTKRDEKARNNNTNNNQETPGQRGANLDDSTVLARFSEMSRTATGSRAVERILKTSPDMLGVIMERLLPDVCALANDVFGTHVMQRVFEIVNEEDLHRLITAMIPDFHKIVTHSYGNFTLQKFVERTNCMTDIREMVTQLVRDRFSEYITHEYANHVVTYLVKMYPFEEISFIHDEVITNMFAICKHKHSNLLVQRCICNSNQEYKATLLTNIVTYSKEFASDPFANYVLQFVLELGISPLNENVVKGFLGDVPNMACGKHSSNVLEKCLRTISAELRFKVVEELLDRQNLPRLLQHQYANYVIQTALHLADAGDFHILNLKLSPWLSTIQNTQHGKRIEQKLRTLQAAQLARGMSLDSFQNATSPGMCPQYPQRPAPYQQHEHVPREHQRTVHITEYEEQYEVDHCMIAQRPLQPVPQELLRQTMAQGGEGTLSVDTHPSTVDFTDTTESFYHQAARSHTAENPCRAHFLDSPMAERAHTDEHSWANANDPYMAEHAHTDEHTWANAGDPYLSTQEFTPEQIGAMLNS